MNSGIKQVLIVVLKYEQVHVKIFNIISKILNSITVYIYYEQGSGLIALKNTR